MSSGPILCSGSGSCSSRAWEDNLVNWRTSCGSKGNVGIQGSGITFTYEVAKVRGTCAVVPQKDILGSILGSIGNYHISLGCRVRYTPSKPALAA